MFQEVGIYLHINRYEWDSEEINQTVSLKFL